MGMNVDLARLKASVDLVAVAQSRGVKLTKQGRDYVGLCPFHRRKRPRSTSRRPKICSIVWAATPEAA